MNGRTSGTFTRMGPARAQAQRERLIYVGGGTVMVALVGLAVLLLANRATVEARSSFEPNAGVPDEVAFGTVVLLAPKEQVAKGTKLGRVELQKIYWPRDKVPEGAVRESEKIQEMFSKVALMPNQPILRANLDKSPPHFGIMDYLPPGHRAVTIEVDATAGVEGWATPGAHVDVLLTYVERKEGNSVTRLAVEDAIVLSYDGSTRANNSQTSTQARGSVNSTSTVTLMVSLEEALQLQTAKHMGKINLVLRNMTDTTVAQNNEFKGSDWGKKPTAKVPQKKDLGFVRFSTEKGGEKTFVIKEDNSWWETGGGEEPEEDFGG